jgi:predicted RNA binding protein YcfA (HicA-like mRNA interferase family)
LTCATIGGIVIAGGERVASVDKIVAKMKRQPNGISPDEAGKVLNHYGYRFDRQNGSHKTYVNKDGDIQTVSKKRPTIKPVYVRQILDKIEG